MNFNTVAQIQSREKLKKFFAKYNSLRWTIRMKRFGKHCKHQRLKDAHR